MSTTEVEADESPENVNDLSKLQEQEKTLEGKINKEIESVEKKRNLDFEAEKLNMKLEKEEKFGLELKREKRHYGRRDLKLRCL